jgi:hypothetical protein
MAQMNLNLITFRVPSSNSDSFEITWSVALAEENFIKYQSDITSINPIWEKLTIIEKCMIVYMKENACESFEALKTIINKRLTENDENTKVNTVKNDENVQFLIESIGDNRLDEIVGKLIQDNVFYVSDNE